MAEDLRIEKERAEIHLTTVGGSSLTGHIFVQPYNPIRGGKEWPADILESSDPYFALQTSDGFVLIAKTNLLEADYEAPDDNQKYGLLPMDVSVTMSGGQKYDGVIWVEGPVNTPRLQDFMNRGVKERFLELHSEHRIRLLNRSCIETIRSKP